MIRIIKGKHQGKTAYVVEARDRYLIVRIPHEAGWPWPIVDTIPRAYARQQAPAPITTEEAPF